MEGGVLRWQYIRLAFFPRGLRQAHLEISHVRMYEHENSAWLTLSGLGSEHQAAVNTGLWLLQGLQGAVSVRGLHSPQSQIGETNLVGTYARNHEQTACGVFEDVLCLTHGHAKERKHGHSLRGGFSNAPALFRR
ncbi:hypothetical protein HRR86_009599 [Exophiala dermatitidis]|nr:hypothetical protein HRR76_009610 [Exophiala dermatitidis]KAJ4558768.1 hypothetical protein HRR77_009600 [Exophiala dermatitidis]KAJ4590478.1 hypothetical protein HRR82_009589 [Exophiala dermatitidis]KAJ4636269.1 hypothetical protein HRR86_009599 [Exophiala dermatitidis]KAJ4698162.1 hypothetical protein HRR87_009298 [Exophiala dermatitidis]